MEILFVHTATDPPTQQWYESIARAATPPLRVTCFSLTIPGLRRKLHWKDLHLAWRTRYPGLMRRYRELRQAAECADVLLLYNGWNIHPDFVRTLPSFNVFCCFDDPESSPYLSEPVAAAFDAVFYGNVASRFQYEHWGCRNLAHLPIFTAPGDVPRRAQRDNILSQRRDNDIILCCGKSQWRRARLTKLAGAFPRAKCVGQGWPGKFVPQVALLDWYLRSKIGWNIHNTTGPINQRLFALAAWNVFQICDNKTGLAECFDLGREVIGFDTVDEAIDATHYYLQHEEERRRMAVQAYERYWREYHAGAIWERINRDVSRWRGGTVDREPSRGDITMRSPLAYHLARIPKSTLSQVESLGRSLLKRFAPRQWPVDERFYLGERVSYAREAHSWVLRGRAHVRRQRDVRPAVLGSTLCWAATTLIGPAGLVRVWEGEFADTFLSLASLDPRRKIEKLTSQNSPSAEADRCDLTVGFVVGLQQAPKQLEDELSLGRSSTRCLWGFAAEQVEELGGTNALYAILEACFMRVNFFWLPDAIVPWIEPLPGPLEGVPILAECSEQKL